MAVYPIHLPLIIDSNWSHMETGLFYSAVAQCPYSLLAALKHLPVQRNQLSLAYPAISHVYCWRFVVYFYHKSIVQP